MNNRACFRSKAHFISTPRGSKNLQIQVSEIYSLGCFGSCEFNESYMSIKQILIKLQNTLSVNHKVEMLQNHKIPVLKDFKRTLQIKASLIRSTFSFAFLGFLFGFVGGCGFLLEYHGCAFGCGLMVPYSATIT